MTTQEALKAIEVKREDLEQAGWTKTRILGTPTLTLISLVLKAAAPIPALLIRAQDVEGSVVGFRQDAREVFADLAARTLIVLEAIC